MGEVSLHELGFYLLVILGFVINEYRKENKKTKARRENSKKETEAVRQQLMVMAEYIKNEFEKEQGVLDKKGEQLVNKKTLEELLQNEPIEKGYAEVIDILTATVKEAYENFRFTFMKPDEEDYLSGYAIKFVFPVDKHQSLYEELFKLTVAYNLKEEEINKRFSKILANGKVIPVGNVLVDDKSTGVSPILNGEDLVVYIVFEDEEYLLKRKEEEKRQEKASEEAVAKQKEMVKAREDGYKTLLRASALMEKLSDELVKEHPEFLEAYNKIREMY